MKKLLLAPLFVMAVAAQAQAACLTINNHYSGAIPENTTVTAYGPVTIANGAGCTGIVIVSQVQSAQPGSAPTMWIEMLDGAVWRRVAEAPGGYVAHRTGAGTFRIQHKNDFSVPRVYSGSTAITR